MRMENHANACSAGQERYVPISELLGDGRDGSSLSTAADRRIASRTGA